MAQHLLAFLNRRKSSGMIAILLMQLVLLSAVNAQLPLSDSAFINQLSLDGRFPEKLLSTRTAVFHTHTFTEKELGQMQEYFQRSGIDAVAYFPTDMLTSGKDVMRAFGDFLVKREIANLLFAEKTSQGFRIAITTFNGKETVVDRGQKGWSGSHRLLLELLKNLSRMALAELKKENLLINDFPETDLIVNPILGKRNEFYAVDMKVDMVAVPRFGDEKLDRELEEIFQKHFPFAHKFVDPGISEKDLRKQGMLYIMCITHSRGQVLRDLYGYRSTKAETAYASITYPSDQVQTKTIQANVPVFKVYFKHIDSGNIFLGNKWDADTTWQQALINNIKAMKAEMRLN